MSNNSVARSFKYSCCNEWKRYTIDVTTMFINELEGVPYPYTYERTSRGDKSLFKSDYFHYVGHGAECNSLNWFVLMVLWNGVRTIATFFFKRMNFEGEPLMSLSKYIILH